MFIYLHTTGGFYMQIQLSEHFTYKKLLRFVLPSIVMMIFTSIYGVVDGLFVSNYVGKTAFAAVNLIMPFLMAISALGFMIGTGGSAIVAKTLGEGKKKQANEYFSMLVYLTLIGGIVLSALGILFSPLIARGLGADGALLTNCVLYARITLLSMPAFMLQNVFQSFFVTAEKPKLGLGVIVIAGVTNMVLDFLLVGVFQIGLVICRIRACRQNLARRGIGDQGRAILGLGLFDRLGQGVLGGTLDIDIERRHDVHAVHRGNLLIGAARDIATVPRPLAHQRTVGSGQKLVVLFFEARQTVVVHVYHAKHLRCQVAVGVHTLHGLLKEHAWQVLLLQRRDIILVHLTFDIHQVPSDSTSSRQVFLSMPVALTSADTVLSTSSIS